MPRRTEIADVLRGAGLTVVEHDGWKARGHPDFDPAGVMLHHTASAPGRDAPSVNVCINGRPDLPGPLCQVVLSRSGVCHVIAAGRANHAGAGSWGGVSGNARWFGIEAENNGIGEPWPQAQLDAYVRCARALARITSRGLVCGHKEYATPKGRKIDPAGIDLDDFRRRVAGDEGDDMPTADEVARATVNLLNREGTALGLLSFGATTVEGVNLGRANFNLLQAISKKVDANADIDEAEIAALVLAGLDPAAIAAAIPEGLAEKVADELAQRLAG